jgi:hypothetical protein
VLKRVSRVRERKVRKRVWVFIEGENVWGVFWCNGWVIFGGFFRGSAGILKWKIEFPYFEI